VKTMLVAVIAISLIAALACGAAEEAEPAAAAKAAAPAADAATAVPSKEVVVAAPKAAATAEPAKQAAPSEAAKVAAVQPTAVTVAQQREAPMKAAEAGFKYVPKPQIPGVYWDYIYDGPRPTEFGENPRFAELVKQGKLPPVAERIAEEFKVNPPPHGIGVYGGTWRVTATGSGPSNHHNWNKKNGNEFTTMPHVGFYEISEDGRVYTLRLRKGIKFDDGVELNMDDIRFAWEDVNMNKTLHETPQSQWLDGITGNIVKFAVIDDTHFTLTWDTPDFILMEGEVRAGTRCTSFYFCFYSPAHYMKQFHEDYADPAALKKMIDDEEVGDWPRLWGLKNNLGTHVGFPTVAPFSLTSQSDTLSTWTSNPYFWVVDPEGNQVPYLDGFMAVRVESREVGVFRGMAGETDLCSCGFRIPEIPLYRSNMDKGGFTIAIWPQVGPGDFTTSVIQTWNTDAEIGEWLRTYDFRQALSMAMDREAMNDTILLGLGTAKNWVSHPSTAFYPGDEAAFHNAQYDPDKANALLDSIGLDKKDSDGFRLRKDGSGERLTFRHLSELGPSADLMELQTDYFADVGIEIKNKPMNAPWTLSYPGKEYLAMLKGHFAYYGANPWFSGWSRCCSVGGGPAFTPDISNLDRSMQVGPNGAVITEGGYQPRCDCPISDTWNPPAAANTFPADPTGTILELQEAFTEGRGIPQFSPRRIELGKFIHRTHGEQKFMLSVAAHTGTSRGINLRRNNFRNAPDNHIADSVGFYGEFYYFIDGKDNIKD